MEKRRGHPGLRAGLGSAAGLVGGGLGGAAAGGVTGAALGAAVSRGDPEAAVLGSAAGTMLGGYSGLIAGPFVGGDLATKRYAKKYNLSDEERSDMRLATAAGNFVGSAPGAALGAHLAAPTNVSAPRRKMKAGSAEPASYHAERDVARKRHASYYTRRQGGKIQRVKYTYPERRN